QGVSVYAALRRAADICADGRSRGQVMADALVERITGRSAAVATPIAVNLVVSDETLLSRSNAPAEIYGYGPIPAAVARELVSCAVGDERSRATLRRLYARPASARFSGDGIQSPVVSSRAGRFHQVPGSALPHAVLRRADPSSRPCPSIGGRGPDQRGQRARTVRTLQLRQGGRRLDRHIAGGRNMQAHSGIHHPDGNDLSVRGPSVAGLIRADGDQRDGSRRGDSDLRLSCRLDRRWPAYCATSTVLARTSWLGGRGSGSRSAESRKVRTSQSRVIANGNPR
ncbi:MAG: hypothetical protein QOE12_3052, partial [Mycobacterium sp.]|nr:hypothetical protein [Mycobacterium sp.]